MGTGAGILNVSSSLKQPGQSGLKIKLDLALALKTHFWKMQIAAVGGGVISQVAAGREQEFNPSPFLLC